MFKLLSITYFLSGPGMDVWWKTICRIHVFLTWIVFGLQGTHFGSDSDDVELILWNVWPTNVSQALISYRDCWNSSSHLQIAAYSTWNRQELNLRFCGTKLSSSGNNYTTAPYHVKSAYTFNNQTCNPL